MPPSFEDLRDPAGPHPRPGKAPAREPEQPSGGSTHPAPGGHLRTETGIGEEFNLADAEHLLIYGSWADRCHGTPGPPPNDIDVLVVGSLDRADVYDAADWAQVRLGMQVNPVIRPFDAMRRRRNELKYPTGPGETIMYAEAQRAIQDAQGCSRRLSS